jgi:hypothetical protein
MKHIIPISGKDSLATAIIQKQLYPEFEYEYIFNPTGKELPETLEWLKLVEQTLNIEIKFVGFDMRETDEWKSGFRPAIFARWCTRKCKIEPMEYYFNCEGVVYYGLRIDEPERIGFINKGKSELTPRYPLRENNINLESVLKIVSDANLQPPTFHWQKLEDYFTSYFGKEFLTEKFTPYQLIQLFAWRSRNNCYDCFNMKKIEWVGLAEFHPDIFWRCSQEEEVLDTREKTFLTIKDYPLSQLYLDRELIFDRYVKRMANQINKLRQFNMFENNNLFEDLLQNTSCGLLCGK